MPRGVDKELPMKQAFLLLESGLNRCEFSEKGRIRCPATNVSARLVSWIASSSTAPTCFRDKGYGHAKRNRNPSRARPGIPTRAAARDHRKPVGQRLAEYRRHLVPVA